MFSEHGFFVFNISTRVRWQIKDNIFTAVLFFFISFFRYLLPVRIARLLIDRRTMVNNKMPEGIFFFLSFCFVLVCAMPRFFSIVNIVFCSFSSQHTHIQTEKSCRHITNQCFACFSLLFDLFFFRYHKKSTQQRKRRLRNFFLFNIFFTIFEFFAQVVGSASYFHSFFWFFDSVSCDYFGLCWCVSMSLLFDWTCCCWCCCYDHIVVLFVR